MAKFVKTNKGWNVYSGEETILYQSGRREDIQGEFSGEIIKSPVDGELSFRPRIPNDYIQEYGPIFLSSIVSFLIEQQALSK